MTISRIYVTRLIGRAVKIRSSDLLDNYAIGYSKDDQNLPNILCKAVDLFDSFFIKNNIL